MTQASPALVLVICAAGMFWIYMKALQENITQGHEANMSKMWLYFSFSP